MRFWWCRWLWHPTWGVVPVALCVSQDPWLLVLALWCVFFLCIPTAAAENSASQLLMSGNRFLQAPLAEASCRLLADSFCFWLQFIIHPPTALCDTSSHSLWFTACSLLWYALTGKFSSVRKDLTQSGPARTKHNVANLCFEFLTSAYKGRTKMKTK